MKKIVALSLGILFAGVSLPASAGNWVMLNPAPVVNTPNTYVNSSNFFASYTPPANAVITYLSWDLSPYGNGNTSATYEICMLPGTSRCFDVSKNSSPARLTSVATRPPAPSSSGSSSMAAPTPPSPRIRATT